MSRHSNQVQGPAVYSMQPPSIKLDRKAAVKAARKYAYQNQEPLPAGLARMLEYPEGPNRRLIL